MAEKSLATPPKDVNTANLNQEAMVRGVLRALEHLGFALRRIAAGARVASTPGGRRRPRWKRVSDGPDWGRRHRGRGAPRRPNIDGRAGGGRLQTTDDGGALGDRRAAVRGSARRQTPGSSHRGHDPSFLRPLPR